MNDNYINEQQKIMEKYWFFKPDPTLQNNLMVFLFECDSGWNSMIDELCSKLEKLIDEKYPKFKKDFEVVQVKEKYGTLRFYTSYGNDDIWDLIDEYEKISEKTCEHCGDTETAKMRESHHWYRTLCDKCFEEWK